jgi:hypothetical protein
LKLQEGKQQRPRQQLQGRKGSSYRVGKEAATGPEREAATGPERDAAKV